MGWVEEANGTALEKTDEEHAGYKSTHMGKPSDASATTTQARPPADELKDKPEPQNESCGDIHRAGEEPQRD